MSAAQLVAGAVDAYGRLQEPLRTELIESKALDEVAAAWLEDSADAATEMVPELIEVLHLLACGDSLVESERAAERCRRVAPIRRQQAVEKIYEAAELLWSNPPGDIRPSHAIGRSDKGGLAVNLEALKAETAARRRSPMPPEETGRDQAFDLRNTQTAQFLADMGHLDIFLRDVAKALESVDVTPVWKRLGPIVPVEHVGTRGGAADATGALNGIAVRWIRDCLPDNLAGNYALIANLANLAKLDLSRQLVRGILLRGHT